MQARTEYSFFFNLLKDCSFLNDFRSQMPFVLITLQRSVEAILLGKLARPDWIMYGVPKSSKIYTFTLSLPNEMNNMVMNGRSFVSDGKYLYLHTNRGLLKIGSGYGGTIGGQLYAHKADFYPNETGWLGYANVSSNIDDPPEFYLRSVNRCFF